MPLFADVEPDVIVVGKISFNPKDVLGHGAGGTFVFRWVAPGTPAQASLHFCLGATSAALRQAPSPPGIRAVQRFL